MDEKIEQQLKKQLEHFKRNAKRYTEKNKFLRRKSSLEYVIKTKEQAARFMKLLELASSEK